MPSDIIIDETEIRAVGLDRFTVEGDLEVQRGLDVVGTARFEPGSGESEKPCSTADCT